MDLLSFGPDSESFRTSAQGLAEASLDITLRYRSTFQLHPPELLESLLSHLQYTIAKMSDGERETKPFKFVTGMCQTLSIASLVEMA